MANLKHFRKWQKEHPNFMTPHIIKLWEMDVYIVEFSEGTDFDRCPIYGITVFKQSGDVYDNNLKEFPEISKMRYSYKEAQAYFKNVITRIETYLHNPLNQR